MTPGTHPVIPQLRPIAACTSRPCAIQGAVQQIQQQQFQLLSTRLSTCSPYPTAPHLTNGTDQPPVRAPPSACCPADPPTSSGAGDPGLAAPFRFSTACSVPNCAQCSFDSAAECTRCEAGYFAFKYSYDAASRAPLCLDCGSLGCAGEACIDQQVGAEWV